MKIINFILGGITSYVYLYLGIILSAFSFIKPSAFLFNKCAREKVGKSSENCIISNEVGLVIFDLVHYMIVAICIIGLIVALNFLLNRKKYVENLYIFSVGFILIGLIFYIPELSYISIFLFSSKILIFLGLYRVALMYGLKKSIP